MVPTTLGIALIQALDRCDDSLVKPNLRASMEQQVARIAAGEERKDIVLENNLRLFSDKYQQFVSPAAFDKVVRPLFIDEAATHAIIDAAIAAKREYKGQLKSLNDGHLAKAEAKADIAAAAASQMERARLASGRERDRASMLTSGDASKQILGALFS